MSRIWIYAVPVVAAVATASGLLLAYSLFIDARPPESVVVVLLCDSDLRAPVEEPGIEHSSGVIGRFERRAGVRVQVRYGAPGALAGALERDRAGDLILTRDGAWLEAAGEQGIIAEARTVAGQVAVAVLTTSPNLDAALEFAEFLAGPASREVFEMYGFSEESNEY